MFKIKLSIIALSVTLVSVLIFAQPPSKIMKTKKAPPPDISNNRLPIVFSKDYDISILGLENFHPFDSKKYGKVYKYLQDHVGVTESSTFTPTAVTDEQLLTVHTEPYLTSLKKSRTIAYVAEMPMLSKLPNSTLEKCILNPMKLATGGTILGAQLALDSGYAINLSGGYHHAKSGNGEGFCFFADINLAILELQKTKPDIKVMIVDLDAHQGNGHEAISGNADNIIIYDIYNGDIYPYDEEVKPFIDYNISISSHTSDSLYLSTLKTTLPRAISSSKPDFIIYNAGTDIYENDPLGALSVSKEGIINRDEFVFDQAIKGNIPILMVLSGGYTKESAQIIGESIENIIKKKSL